MPPITYIFDPVQTAVAEYVPSPTEGSGCHEFVEGSKIPPLASPEYVELAVVVERAGHSRSSWGRAYLPTYIPGGMQPEDIQ